MNARRTLRLGFVPLIDAAALIVARDEGFFAAEGLEIELCREASWATVRDKVAVGALEGAHMLAPLAIATSLGLGCEPEPMVAPLALNFGGAAVTLSKRLTDVVGESAAALAALLERRRAQQSSRLTFAVVFPYSTHNYLLREWLTRAGIDPDREVRLTVAPPARTAELLNEGVIEGFCAGEPWNEVAVRAGAGRVAMRASRFAPEAPDKVFATTESWAMGHASELKAVIRSLVQASAWVEEPAHRAKLAAVLARPENLDAPTEAISAGLADIRFCSDGANRPRESHADWIVDQMRRWGQLGDGRDAGVAAARVYRPDLFDRAMAASGA